MENKNKELQQFLKNNPNATKAAIVEGIDMKGLPLFNLLKKMTNDGIIIEQGHGDEKTYSLVNVDEVSEEPQNIEADDEQQNEEVVKEEIITTTDSDEQTENNDETDSTNINEQLQQQTETEETEELKTTGRDSSKYRFNGQEYGKGPLVRAVVAQYVADNPTVTFIALKEIFPDSLLKRFGIFQAIDEAKTIGGKGTRYFFKDEHIIQLADKQVVVCNQFTLDNLQPFLKVAKRLGYKVK